MRNLKIRGAPRGVRGGSPGTRRDPLNQQKIDFLLKMVFQTLIFVDFCTENRFSCFVRVFSSIFHEKSMKIRRKKLCIFVTALSFFSTCRPSRNHVFYNTKATFLLFEFFLFFAQKKQKMTSKIEERLLTPKTPKRGPRGLLFSLNLVPN